MSEQVKHTPETIWFCSKCDQHYLKSGECSNNRWICNDPTNEYILKSSYERIEKERDDLLEAARKMINTLNEVTAPWRHNEEVPEESMDALTFGQIEFEEAIQKVTK